MPRTTGPGFVAPVIRLILLVFAIWALDGFGYPSTPAPIALNMVSKVLAFATALTLFLPGRSSPPSRA